MVMRILVTDGDQRPALAIARSLAKRGIEVLVGEERVRSLASASKHCVDHVTYPSPYRYPEVFSRFLLEVVKQKQIGMVLPLTDVTTYLLAQDKGLQQYSRIPIPEFEAFNFVSNKWTLIQYAQKVGIPIPKTHFLQCPENLQDVLDQLEYPVVIKPSRSRILTECGWILTRVHYAESETQLVRLYQEKEYLRYPSLLQERIIGPGIGLFLLFNRGEPVTAFAHMRLREKPPSGGVSVLRQSISVDPVLERHARLLLQPLGWHGVAMVEYKVDHRSGRPLLMEVNGRFWGSLQLAIDAGVDFPYLLWQLALDGHVEAPQTYPCSIKSRWLLGDLDHLLLRVFKSDQDLNLPEGFPGRLVTVMQFLKLYEPGLHYEILSIRDPKPFLYEVSQYLKSLIRGNACFDRL